MASNLENAARSYREAQEALTKISAESQQLRVRQLELEAAEQEAWEALDYARNSLLDHAVEQGK